MTVVLPSTLSAFPLGRLHRQEGRSHHHQQQQPACGHARLFIRFITVSVASPRSTTSQRASAGAAVGQTAVHLSQAQFYKLPRRQIVPGRRPRKLWCAVAESSDMQGQQQNVRCHQPALQSLQGHRAWMQVAPHPLVRQALMQDAPCPRICHVCQDARWRRNRLLAWA